MNIQDVLSKKVTHFSFSKAEKLIVDRLSAIHFDVIDNIVIINYKPHSAPNGVVIIGTDFGANDCFFNDDGTGTYSSDLTYGHFDKLGRLVIFDI